MAVVWSSHPKFQIFDDLSPVVSTEDCFDAMLVPTDHVSRRPTDTYYVNATTVLRAHTSAHEVPTMKQGVKAFLVSGDVYRRDEIDASHYPVFHQMEGVRIFSEVREWEGERERERSTIDVTRWLVLSNEQLPADMPREEKVAIVEAELKKTLEGLVAALFGKVEMRWVDAYFPFTHPSLELEIFFNVRTKLVSVGPLTHSLPTRD